MCAARPVPPGRRHVSGGQRLCAVLVPEHRAAAEDEEHLFCSVMHVHAALRCAGGEFVQRCTHPSIVRPPKRPAPCSSVFVVSVPHAGEQVLSCHVDPPEVAVTRSGEGRSLQPRPAAEETRRQPRLTATSSPDPHGNRSEFGWPWATFPHTGAMQEACARRVVILSCPAVHRVARAAPTADEA
jgi:hypothetical protein